MSGKLIRAHGNAMIHRMSPVVVAVGDGGGGLAVQTYCGVNMRQWIDVDPGWMIPTVATVNGRELYMCSVCGRY